MWPPKSGLSWESHVRVHQLLMIRTSDQNGSSRHSQTYSNLPFCLLDLDFRSQERCPCVGSDRSAPLSLCQVECGAAYQRLLFLQDQNCAWSVTNAQYSGTGCLSSPRSARVSQPSDPSPFFPDTLDATWLWPHSGLWSRGLLP